MSKIAVDVVLLPSEDMRDKAIDVNKRLLKNSLNGIRLNKIDCFPHITLAMGCIEEEEIEKIDKILQNLASEFGKFNLKTISIQEQKAWFRIKNDKNLQLLHEAGLNRLASYFTYEVTEEMVYKSKNEKIDDITLDYIKNFPLNSSFENYVPHITVGSYDMDMILPEVEFEASELALCHLGNHCTCRKIIVSHNLKGV